MNVELELSHGTTPLYSLYPTPTGRELMEEEEERKKRRRRKKRKEEEEEEEEEEKEEEKVIEFKSSYLHTSIFCISTLDFSRARYISIVANISHTVYTTVCYCYECNFFFLDINFMRIIVNKIHCIGRQTHIHTHNALYNGLCSLYY